MINSPKCPPGEIPPSNVNKLKISCAGILELIRGKEVLANVGFKKSRIPNEAVKITRDPIQMFIFSNHRGFVKSTVANIVVQMNAGIMPTPK